MEVVKQLTGELLNTPRLTCKESHKQNSLIRVVQARIREAKGELTAEIRVNTERVNQLTTLLRERKQYERDLNARQKDLVSVTSCRRHDTHEQCQNALCQLQMEQQTIYIYGMKQLSS